MGTQELAEGNPSMGPASTPSAAFFDSAESGDREASAGSLIPGSSSAESTTLAADVMSGVDAAVWRACQLLHCHRPGRHVYFVLAPRSEMVKIGSSCDPLTRSHVLQAHSPELLHLVALAPYAGFEGEWALHRRLAQWRAHGEWFLLTPDVAAAIKEAQR